MTDRHLNWVGCWKQNVQFCVLISFDWLIEYQVTEYNFVHLSMWLGGCHIDVSVYRLGGSQQYASGSRKCHIVLHRLARLCSNTRKCPRTWRRACENYLQWCLRCVMQQLVDMHYFCIHRLHSWHCQQSSVWWRKKWPSTWSEVETDSFIMILAGSANLSLANIKRSTTNTATTTVYGTL